MPDEELLEEEAISDADELDEIPEDTIDEYSLYDGECRIFHHEPYHTPNNYDIYFDQNNVPSNIKVENAASLEKRLQKLMPLTKFIHLNMDSESLHQTNHVLMSTSLKINNHEVKFI